MADKINFTTINFKDFIKAKPRGEFDFEQSKSLLVELVSVDKSPSAYNVLIDIRDAYGHLDISDIYEIAFELSRHIGAFRNKIAFVVRDDVQAINASFLEVYAHDRGLNIKAFTEFEETIKWLQPAPHN